MTRVQRNRPKYSPPNLVGSFSHNGNIVNGGGSNSLRFGKLAFQTYKYVIATHSQGSIILLGSTYIRFDSPIFVRPKWLALPPRVGVSIVIFTIMWHMRISAVEGVPDFGWALQPKLSGLVALPIYKSLNRYFTVPFEPYGFEPPEAIASLGRQFMGHLSVRC